MTPRTRSAAARPAVATADAPPTPPSTTSPFRIHSEAAEMVALDSLLEHPDNPREGDIGLIAESIRLNGFWGTLTVQRSTRFICAGNHRARAALMLGGTHLPVTWADVDDAEALRILLADNAASDAATNDNDALFELLQAMPSLEGTGYDGDDLDALTALLSPSDPTPPPAARDVPEPETGRYGVIVECKGEDDQRSIYERLTAEGYACRVVVA